MRHHSPFARWEWLPRLFGLSLFMILILNSRPKVSLSSKLTNPRSMALKVRPRPKVRIVKTKSIDAEADMDYITPKAVITSKLDWMSHFTDVIPDAFTIDSGLKFKPSRSGTVSGALILRLLEQKGQKFVDEEISRALSQSVEDVQSMVVSVKPKERLAAERRSVYATVAVKIAESVTGKVSLEVDPRVSHDANLVVEEVRNLAKSLTDLGVDVKAKILFKIPGTWEGILAAKMITLQEEYVCQVTHVYSMAQATAAADAKVAVIQPYVGRVNDWYHMHPDKIPRDVHEVENQGVNLVKKIYNYMRKYDMNTKVMAASIRNVEDALSLSGVDFMVMPPPVIKSLATMPGSFGKPELTPEDAAKINFTPQELRGHELGECAEALLEESIKSASETIDKVEEILSNTAIGNL